MKILLMESGGDLNIMTDSFQFLLQLLVALGWPEKQLQTFLCLLFPALELKSAQKATI